MKYRSVQLGIIAISVASVAILLMSMLYFYRVQQQQNDRLAAITDGQRQSMIESIMELKLIQEQTPVFDNSAWDELRDAMDENDQEWLDVNIGYMSVQYHGSTIAVFDRKKGLVYDHQLPEYKDFDFYSELRLQALFRDDYRRIFYSVKEDKLFAYYIYGIVSADDILTRKEDETGYLMLVKEYTDSLVNEFSRSLGSVKMNIALTQSVLEDAAVANQGNFFHYIALNNQYGNPVAYLYFTAENEVESIFARLMAIMFVLLGLVMLILLAVIIYTQARIVRPLHIITSVFNSGDTRKIESLRDDKTEFGVLTKNIDNFFKQKELSDQMHKAMVERNKQLTDEKDLIAKLNHQVEAQQETIETLNRHIKDANHDKELKGAQLAIHEQMLDEQMQNIINVSEDLEVAKSSLKFSEKKLREANVVISDNQNYAVRLRYVMQVAITPTKNVFNDFFLYEKTMEHIGGDFCFARKIGNWIICGVGDCNLHGVAGAMLSSVDMYLLIDIMQARRMTELRPDLVLNDLNKRIQSTMGQELETDIERDGLHISMFMYDTQTLKGCFAGSKRTMVLMRRGEVSEYFGDNLSVGKVHDDKSFNCVNVQLQPDDYVYMYSDGCTDVVGGPYCKKLLAVNFKKEISRIHSVPIADQKLKFKEFYEDWIGTLEQSDDITLLGFKV